MITLSLWYDGLSITGSINKINETYVCPAIELVFTHDSAKKGLSVAVVREP